MKKLITNLLTLVCIIAICISGYKIFSTLSDYKKANDVYSEIRDMKENLDTPQNNEDSEGNKPKDLSSINSDYEFWINVEGTNIDYPVVKGHDNKFYLNHDFNKNYLPAGSIFLDYRNEFESDLNSVIYGHHMRNSTMFGQLEKFKDKDFFNKHKTITIQSKDKTYEYEIFAIGIYSANFGYNKVDFNGKKDFDNYINRILDNSLYFEDIVNSDSQILTLSTCSYEYDNARTALFAVRK